MKWRGFSLRPLALAILTLGLVLVAATPATAVAPAGKHYAGMLVMIDPETGEIESAPACLSFTRKEVCNEMDDCGTWTMVERTKAQNSWTLYLAWEEEGTLIEAHCAGMTERRGPRSSIAGTVLATVEGVRINAAFAGSATTRARCREFGLSDD